ncbi:MAG: hypothetical protein EH225_00095 [Calditrichaeota bacterium]|nr:hypothetical protein [Calditrichota bacterium]RQW08653.1 MAG: hypothetical protein EH225_00095 [Calditrichota bacterium]
MTKILVITGLIFSLFLLGCGGDQDTSEKGAVQEGLDTTEEISQAVDSLTSEMDQKASELKQKAEETKTSIDSLLNEL